MSLKLRAVITVEFDANDFMDAAHKQEEFEALTSELKKEYGDATYAIGERRAARPYQKGGVRRRKEAAPAARPEPKPEPKAETPSPVNVTKFRRGKKSDEVRPTP